MAVRRIAECILRDEHSILSVSSLIQGHYGLDNLCMGVPTIVGSKGVEKVLDINLNGEEQLQLMRSADALKKVLASLDLPE
jgi:L-lactate dehydrogenase